jgi:hypothetical protein
MKRMTPRGRTASVTRSPRANTSASLIDAWWATVLAGDVSEPHPVFGDVKVQLHGSRLRLSGELESDAERKDLIDQARQRIGHGIDGVDVADLKVASRKEKPGILEQTLVSAFPSRDAAEFARDFVIKHSRVVPKQSEIVDTNRAETLRKLVPGDFARAARKALDSRQALLILTVDETEAFRVRELLEEDTRSEWTVASPPQLSARTKR